MLYYNEPPPRTANAPTALNETGSKIGSFFRNSFLCCASGSLERKRSDDSAYELSPTTRNAYHQAHQQAVYYAATFHDQSYQYEDERTVDARAEQRAESIINCLKKIENLLISHIASGLHRNATFEKFLTRLETHLNEQGRYLEYVVFKARKNRENFKRRPCVVQFNTPSSSFANSLKSGGEKPVLLKAKIGDFCSISSPKRSNFSDPHYETESINTIPVVKKKTLKNLSTAQTNWKVVYNNNNDLVKGIVREVFDEYTNELRSPEQTNLEQFSSVLNSNKTIDASLLAPATITTQHYQQQTTSFSSQEEECPAKTVAEKQNCSTETICSVRKIFKDINQSIKDQEGSVTLYDFDEQQQEETPTRDCCENEIKTINYERRNDKSTQWVGSRDNLKPFPHGKRNSFDNLCRRIKEHQENEHDTKFQYKRNLVRGLYLSHIGKKMLKYLKHMQSMGVLKKNSLINVHDCSFIDELKTRLSC